MIIILMIMVINVNNNINDIIINDNMKWNDD